MCLDVELKASFSVANYTLVAANEAQFASAGSFAEIADFNAANDADLVVVAVEGKTAVDALIVKDGEGTTPADLEGKTIGVKGKLQPSLKAMLAQAGLVEGTDYTTVGIEGFDPLVHIGLPGLAAFTGYKSNEPGQLERAGVPFTVLDPSKDGIPGSFGILYTNAGFLNEHPTAAQDFVRAAMRGHGGRHRRSGRCLADRRRPDQRQRQRELPVARGRAVPLAHRVEAGQRVHTRGPAGRADRPRRALQAQIDAYDAIGIFTTKPPIEGTYDEALIAGVYGPDGKVVWPAG